jgi:hypothetical protein
MGLNMNINPKFLRLSIRRMGAMPHARREHAYASVKRDTRQFSFGEPLGLGQPNVWFVLLVVLARGLTAFGSLLKSVCYVNGLNEWPKRMA